MTGPRATTGFPACLSTSAPPATLLIRVMVGVVFASEGIQKFLYSDALGAGRFAKIGIPAPAVMAPFVGTVETVCGLLLISGLLTRLAAVPLLGTILVAISSTKLPILLGHGYWSFANPGSAHGFWAALHEARTDLSMLLGSTFLVWVGAGPWSLDAWILRRAGT
jgi:uncharacterized membrane protein YphA (DoxX/SURF4 family)